MNKIIDKILFLFGETDKQLEQKKIESLKNVLENEIKDCQNCEFFKVYCGEDFNKPFFEEKRKNCKTYKPKEFLKKSI